MTDQWNVKKEKRVQQGIAKVLRVGISIFLAVGGIFILMTQLIPLTESFVKGKLLQAQNKELISPVPGAYKREIEGEFAYWDPSVSYFENLIQEAQVLGASAQSTIDPETNRFREIVIDESYAKPMAITIASLQINSINVAPNVESYDENIYNRVLKNGVAHFKGTSLPGDGGNAFIYGHSAVESYFSAHEENPETIFTRLEDIELGDSVDISKDGKTYTYVVRKKKIVDPNDFSILEVQGRKETVTLMTCHPAGIGTNRLIVTAERIENE
ncbi:MAG: sortase [Candidatus Dojkabacteria bacterium]|nr:MAG: sortase [Candidatus Dojkabacteria bacterium]